MQGTTEIYVGIEQNIYHLGDREIIMKDVPRYKITWRKTVTDTLPACLIIYLELGFSFTYLKYILYLNYFNIYIRRNTNFFALQICALFI